MYRKYSFGSRWRWALIPILWAMYLTLHALPLAAHGGGVPRLTGEITGPYRIFAWTQPEPLRVGDIHLSIGVVKAEANNTPSAETLDQPVTNASVTVHLLPLAQDTTPLTVPALLQAQLGSYYYEADVTLPTAGDWRFTIEVSSELGVGATAFVASVATAREVNWLLVVAAGVLLFCLLGLIGLWNRLQTLQAKEVVP